MSEFASSWENVILRKLNWYGEVKSCLESRFTVARAHVCALSHLGRPCGCHLVEILMASAGLVEEVARTSVRACPWSAKAIGTPSAHLASAALGNALLGTSDVGSALAGSENELWLANGRGIPSGTSLLASASASCDALDGDHGSASGWRRHLHHDDHHHGHGTQSASASGL